jgi:hypothetical protein
VDKLSIKIFFFSILKNVSFLLLKKKFILCNHVDNSLFSLGNLWDDFYNLWKLSLCLEQCSFIFHTKLLQSLLYSRTWLIILAVLIHREYIYFFQFLINTFRSMICNNKIHNLCNLMARMQNLKQALHSYNFLRSSLQTNTSLAFSSYSKSDANKFFSKF